MFDDHERFMNKNRKLAEGYETANTQDKVKVKFGDAVPAERAMSCFNCKKKNRCLEFKSKSTGGTSGVVSIDSTTIFLCDKYDPMPPQKKEKALSGSQIKNIMKAARSGRL